MKLSTLMAGYTPSSAFAGWEMADDLVIAIDTSANQDADVGDYYVLQTGVEGVDPSLNSETADKNYLRAGKSSTKTGTQRKFSVKGDRYIGDEAQDKLLSYTMKYATGNAAIVNYVFFSVLTGKGEKGKATVAVNTDGGGNGGENASFDVGLSKSGAKPDEFDWNSTAKSTRLSALSVGSCTLTPTFSSGVLTYACDTTNASDSVTATCVDTTDGVATVLMGGTVETGAITWVTGKNTVSVVVTNGNEIPTTYTITVTKS